MASPEQKIPLIFRSLVNSFHYLYQDAEYFRAMARQPNLAGNFDRVRLARTGLLLYIFSLEGLINRSWDHFLPERCRNFFVNHESGFSLEDKWELLPLLASTQQAQRFDRARSPWNKFAELVRIRNDFVHPKHDRAVDYVATESGNLDSLSPNKIPADLDIKASSLLYPQTRIPKDPNVILPEHVDIVKEVVDAIVEELDRLLDGVLTKDDWLHSDALAIIYPPSATSQDFLHLSLPAEERMSKKDEDTETT